MSSRSDDTKAALALLKQHRASLTPQQTRTIRGQIRAGEIGAALSGMNKILKRVKRHE